MTVAEHDRAVDAALDAVTASDPRVNDQYVRRVRLASHEVVLVGVVHDHPAAIHRVRAIIDGVEPDAVAVELPNLLVPALAPSDETDDAGGEMAAAIRATTSRRTIGIDVPGRRLYRAARTEHRRQDPSVATMLRTARSFAQITARAGLGRLAHKLGKHGVPWMPSIGDLEDEHSYDLGDDASPSEQAENEAAHLLRSETMLRTLDPPATTKFVDGVREQFMAERLRELRHADVVVGVVGYGHLESVTKKLQAESG